MPGTTLLGGRFPMIKLPTAIPDFEVLLALEPEELGAKMLFLLRSRTEAMFNLATLRGELWSQSLSGWPQYPREREKEIDLPIAEALAWLEAQGLIVPAGGLNGQNGWRHLSRRARKFENQVDFKNFVVARRLPKETLHAKISDVVWQAFISDERAISASPVWGFPSATPLQSLLSLRFLLFPTATPPLRIVAMQRCSGLNGYERSHPRPSYRTHAHAAPQHHPVWRETIFRGAVIPRPPLML
jgi:hypothetical protein